MSLKNNYTVFALTENEFEHIRSYISSISTKYTALIILVVFLILLVALNIYLTTRYFRKLISHHDYDYKFERHILK